jgi:hypothetical protein
MLFGLIFLAIYFSLAAVFGFLMYRKKSGAAAFVGVCIGAMFYGLMGVGVAQGSTMSICKAEGVIHGQQAAATCRANLRLNEARQVIHQCRTKVIEAEHRVFGQVAYHKINIPRDCIGYTLMSTRLAGVNYVPVPAQIKLAPYSKVLDVQKPVPLTRYHSGSTAINY